MEVNQGLIKCLKNYSEVQLSYEPDIPGADEIIRHKIKGYDLFATKSGALLLVHLKNPATNEEYTYSFPDIFKTELANFSDSHDKWYLYSLDRSKFQEDIRDEEMIYRFIFTK
ncbi:hypothetical protein [Bacillus sp. MZGC1]|uniref:hypothetical protein n=1 Tax=Bacillus sp. MZGC1 TaxID=2108543 RepID=UPI000D03DBD0|nr:hypothetical protein [Bacillus sp. MZGC1]PRS46407.1 hypothetical protein C6Y06_19635 [Bacillus sp. MZGC1]